MDNINSADGGQLGDNPDAGTDDYAGYVYVATNPAMPDIVKIGSTTQNDPQSRITSLFTTSVPAPFELEYAAAISDDPARVEQALHQAFGPQRVHPKREFFEIEPQQAIAILKLLDAADVTERARADAEAEISQEDRNARERVRRRPILNFHDLDVPTGSILTYLHDEEVQVEVVDDRRVQLVQLPDGQYPNVTFDDEPKYLSPLSRDLLGVSRNVHPTRYWRVEDGRSLNEIYNEFHGPRG